MEGLERLENEVLEMNNCNISAIFDYLKTLKLTFSVIKNNFFNVILKYFSNNFINIF